MLGVIIECGDEGAECVESNKYHGVFAWLA